MTRERLAQQVEIEMDALAQVVLEIDHAVGEAGPEPSVIVVTAVGAFLHQFYNGVENVLKRIALYREYPLPEGEHYHADLLALSGPESDGPLLDDDLFAELDSFRQFRHVFRMSYSFHLDWNRLTPGAARARPVLERFEAAVRQSLASE